MAAPSLTTEGSEEAFTAIGDWKLLLDEPRPVAEASTQTEVLPSTRPSRWIPWSVAAVLALAMGVALWAPWRKLPEIPLRTTFLRPPDGQIYDFQSSLAVPALSPDGKRIVFGAKGADGKSPLQLWVRPLDSPTAQPLSDTERGMMPFWSPDSRWIGFASQDRKLKKIDIQGGPPILIADLPGDLRGASWRADGVIVLGLNSVSSIMRVSSAHRNVGQFNRTSRNGSSRFHKSVDRTIDTSDAPHKQIGTIGRSFSCFDCSCKRALRRLRAECLGGPTPPLIQLNICLCVSESGTHLPPQQKRANRRLTRRSSTQSRRPATRASQQLGET